jgi:hypothetical protein
VGIAKRKRRLVSRRLESSKTGADDRTRTGDLLITNQLLYQLSYIGMLVSAVGNSAGADSIHDPPGCRVFFG